MTLKNLVLGDKQKLITFIDEFQEDHKDLLEKLRKEEMCMRMDSCDFDCKKCAYNYEDET